MRRTTLALAVVALPLLTAARVLAGEGPAASPPEPATPSSGAASEAPVESLRRARGIFEYGDYGRAASALGALLEQPRFDSPELREEAWRLLGLARFYQGSQTDAQRAFLEMLRLDPDAELDPFYVPPAAVTFFDQVKRDQEPMLRPIRARRHAEEETRRKAAIQEAQQRQQHDLEEQQRRLAQSAPAIERRVVEREFWVTLLPFGVGQLQNGDRALGIALASSEMVAGATSAGSALLIEGLRDPATGKFSASDYPLAHGLAVTKWIGAGLFYALWVGGAIHAAIHFESETRLPDRLVSQSALVPQPLPPPTLPAGVHVAPAQPSPPMPSPSAAPPAAPDAPPRSP